MSLSKQSAIQIRVNTKEKQLFTSIINSLGLNISDSFSLFIRKVVKENGMPFDLSSTKSAKAEDLIDYLHDKAQKRTPTQKNPGEYKDSYKEVYHKNIEQKYGS